MNVFPFLCTKLWKFGDFDSTKKSKNDLCLYVILYFRFLFFLLLVCFLLYTLFFCHAAGCTGIDFANIHIFSVLYTGSSEIIMYGTYYHGHTVNDSINNFLIIRVHTGVRIQFLSLPLQDAVCNSLTYPR